MNKLPEKLILLRKNVGLPQSEVAEKLMVSVNEYMNWENGNSIPVIEQLQALAEFYHVDLVALLDNTMTFIAPAPVTPQVEESATIPFQQNNGINATQQITDLSQTIEQTKEAELGKTKVMSSVNLKDTQEEEEETPKKKVVVKKRNLTPIILGVCAVLVVVLAAILFFNRGGSSSTVSMNDTNRLVLTPRYSLYLQNSGSISAKGEGYDTASIAGSVQISGREDFVLGLKKDGTVVSTSDDFDVSEWTNVVSIAAGNHHAVGLLKDGSVVCTGSEAACNVSDWQNVASIYAGNEVTVALTESGTFLSSGGVSIPSDTNVKSVALSEQAMYYITSGGSVKGISLNGGVVQNTNTLGNITAIASGTDFVAALKNDGTVTVVGTNEAITEEVSDWENVKFIAAEGNTLVAITKDGKMYGTGDNTYNQYENTAEASATATPTATASTQLDSVTGISFTETTENVQIKWDAVENADYYEVTVEPNIGTLAKSASNSASISASELTDGQVYTVTIVAKANDSDKYEDSTPTTMNYTYSAKTITLDMPTGLTAYTDDYGAWIISWDAVSNASSYVVEIDGNVAGTVSNNYYTIAGSNLIANGTYTIGVRAISSDSTYTESGTTQISSTYIPPQTPEPEPPVEPTPEVNEEEGE